MGASVSRGVAADISLSPSLSVGISVVVARVRRARQQVVAPRLATGPLGESAGLAADLMFVTVAFVRASGVSSAGRVS